MKFDPYNNQGLYEEWKKNPHNSNVSRQNNKIMQQYIFDMELGRNVSRHSPKKGRSYTRLNSLRHKLFYIAELLEKNYKIKDMTKATEDSIHHIFNGMRTGKIRKANGGVYIDTGDYVKIFKAFWHWHQLVNHKKGIAIPDITIDLDTTRNKEPKFVYFTEEQLNGMIKIADPDMKVVMLFLFDTGMRVTEMLNIKVSDFLNDFKEVNIRQETSKTFGRRIKLMMSYAVVKNYVNLMKLGSDNFFFKLSADDMNKRLKPIGRSVLGKDDLTLYDFRHSSACYWYPRYPNIQGLLYRFGWKQLEMAHYYSRFLGMEDTVTEESMLLGVTKTELEREMNKLKRENKAIWENLKKIAVMARNSYDAVSEHREIEPKLKKAVKGLMQRR